MVLFVIIINDLLFIKTNGFSLSYFLYNKCKNNLLSYNFFSQNVLKLTAYFKYSGFFNKK